MPQSGLLLQLGHLIAPSYRLFSSGHVESILSEQFAEKLCLQAAQKDLRGEAREVR
jgi:hypothetical protein